MNGDGLPPCSFGSVQVANHRMAALALSEQLQEVGSD